MNLALWIVQVVLALGFIYSGWMKTFKYEQAKTAWPWVNDVPRGLVTFIGVLELIAVFGLILPEEMNMATVLTPIAAIGLAAVVLFGAIFHIIRKEYKEIGVNIVFFALALFVIIGRL